MVSKVVSGHFFDRVVESQSDVFERKGRLILVRLIEFKHLIGLDLKTATKEVTSNKISQRRKKKERKESHEFWC